MWICCLFFVLVCSFGVFFSEGFVVVFFWVWSWVVCLEIYCGDGCLMWMKGKFGELRLCVFSVVFCVV